MMLRILSCLLVATPLAAQACPSQANAQPRPQRSGAPYPPISVPPPVISVPRPQPAPSTAPPQPQLVIPRPAAITACDPGGCWDSDGRRLNQVGPILMGPQGPCSTQGGVVSCR